MPSMNEIWRRLWGLEKVDFSEQFSPSLLVELPFELWCIIIAAVIAFVWYLYSKESKEVSPFYKAFCGLLRVLIILILIIVMLMPVITVKTQIPVDTYVIMLFDTSTSMKIEDNYGDDELVHVAKALGRWDYSENKIIPPNQNEKPVKEYKRIEILRQIMGTGDIERGQILKKVGKKNKFACYTFNSKIDTIAFDKKSAPVQPDPNNPDQNSPEQIAARQSIQEVEDDDRKELVDQLKIEGDKTALGDAIRKALADHQGHKIASFIIFSDGQSNSGEDPFSAAKLAKSVKAPIYTVGFGSEIEPKNIRMIKISNPPVAPVGDKVIVEAEFDSSGFKENEIVNVKCQFGDLKDVDDEESIKTEEVKLKGNSLRQKVKFIFETNEKWEGKSKIVVSIDKKEGELVQEDNEMSSDIEVKSEDINVLLVENYPKWEYRYLKNSLIRDKVTHVAVVLQSVDDPKEYIVPESLQDLKSKRFKDAEKNQEEKKNQKIVEDCKKIFEATKDGFPKNLEVLKLFDIMIIGDVDLFSPTSPRGLTDEDMNNIKEFADLGKGLVFLAGPHTNPTKFKDTPLEDLLPVEINEDIADTFTSPSENKYSFKLTLTPEGDQAVFLKMEDDLAANQDRWRQLPGFFWFYRINKVKPAASVLAVNANIETDQKTGDFNPRDDVDMPEWPVLVSSFYGEGGRILFSGVDSWWRLRFLKANKYYNRFWHQMMRYMLQKKAADDFRLDFQKQKYDLDEKIYVHGEAKKEGKPFAERKKVTLVIKQGEVDTEVEVDYDQDTGKFQHSFIAEKEGLVSVRFKENEDVKVSANVAKPQLENDQPIMNRELLKNIADETGGEFYYADEVADLVLKMKQRPEKPNIVIKQDELFDAPFWLVAVSVLAGLEWILRKRRRMS